MDEKLLEISKQFWDAMEHADEIGRASCRERV